MDFALTSEQKTFQTSFRRFCEEKIKPNADRADREAILIKENWAALAEIGFFGLYFPEEIGGSNADMISRALAGKELSRVCAGTALSASASTGLCGSPLYQFGTQAQREKFIPSLIAGKTIGAFGLTEPGCGSDVQGIRTQAQRSGEKFLLNGAKMFITNGSVCDVALVFAQTDAQKKHRGFSAFLVEKGTPGFSAGKPLAKMGVRGSPTSELFFEQCAVSEECLLGQEGQGFMIAMQTLEGGRIGMAAWCLGIGEAAFEEALKYAQQRQAFGKTIAQFQGIHFKLADMKVELDTALLLILQAAWKKDQGEAASTSASIAKLFASEAARRATHNAVQIHGGYGYIQEFPVERHYRDARLGEVGEGTSEIQRILIARSLLKEVL